MEFKWNKEKNEKLKKERDVGFIDVIEKLQSGDIIDILKNESPKYKNQYKYILRIKNYVYSVPFVINEKDNYIFLKTIYPSSKYNKIYSKKEEK
jgi:hypothetical protein